MYMKQHPDKFKFNQQFPYHSSCHPATINMSGRILSQDTPAAVSTRFRSPKSRFVVVPISASDSGYGDSGGYPTDRQYHYDITKNGLSSSPTTNLQTGFVFSTPPARPATKSTSNWWSWTFGLITVPFVLWGCPFYLVTMSLPKPYLPQIRSTGTWLKRIVDCASFPLTTILSIILIIPATVFNIYWLYLCGQLFANLFIIGVYKASMITDVVNFLQDIPVIIAINYLWLRGFKLNSLITVLNQKYRKYEYQVSCTFFRIRACLLLLLTVGLHIIRWFSFKKYEPFYEETDAFIIAEKLWEYSTEIFVSLLLPVYVLVCYAIRFELLIIKSLIYELISKRVTPTIAHLSKFKTLFTHAADHIDCVNGIFSLYISLIMGLMILGTIIDAEKLLATIAESALGSIVKNIIGNLQLGGEEVTTIEPEKKTTASKNGTDSKAARQLTRQLNADIACLAGIYALIFYTVWQAVVTNDYVREIHVWLNDFVSGGGGTDIQEKLIEVGANKLIQTESEMNNAAIIMKNVSFGNDPEDFTEGSRLPLIWAHNTVLNDGGNDQFLEKFKMLKAYIHVRMELEKPSLLNIALVGLIVPNLSGRLKRYDVLF